MGSKYRRDREDDHNKEDDEAISKPWPVMGNIREMQMSF